MDYYTMYNFLEICGEQINRLHNAINHLSKLGCSAKSLKPYTDHLEYLNSMMKTMWDEFKMHVEQDKVRIKMCSEINWMPVYGCKYQEIINDQDFKKRWSRRD